MGHSLTLALYLATRSRADRASRIAPTETPDEAAERAGRATAPRPGGPLIWFHTGEDRHGLAPRELALRMQVERGNLAFLQTTNAARRRDAEPGITAQFAPDETLPAIRRFLDHWRPTVAVWTEPDLRPALISETADRGVPLFLVDAHTAEPDPQAWRWLRGMAGSLLTRFDRIVTGGEGPAATLRRLGADPGRIEVSGYLEEGTPALPCNEADRDVLADGLAARPVWLAAEVADDEFDAVIYAYERAHRRAHRLLLILVPDVPGKGAGWLDRLTRRGYRAALRSTAGEPDAETQIFVADTEGEMGLWYRLAPISFLGRSLGTGGGGINPYGAAALGSAILYGPNVRNFRQGYSRLAAAGAARLVRSPSDLAEAVELLLSPDVAARMAHEAWKVSSAGAEVTDRVMDLILTELDAREPA